jgi:hypothetical protein
MIFATEYGFILDAFLMPLIYSELSFCSTDSGTLMIVLPLFSCKKYVAILFPLADFQYPTLQHQFSSSSNENDS